MSDDKPRDLSIIYVTEFLNQFGVWQVFHAFRSKDKAYLDAGTSGRVNHCIELSEYQAQAKRIEELEAEIKRWEQMSSVSTDKFLKLRDKLKQFEDANCPPDQLLAENQLKIHAQKIIKDSKIPDSFWRGREEDLIYAYGFLEGFRLSGKGR